MAQPAVRTQRQVLVLYNKNSNTTEIQSFFFVNRNSQIIDLSKLKQKPVQAERRSKPPLVINNIHDNIRADEIALHEFNTYKYKDGENQEAIKILKAKFPEQPVDAETLERQQQELISNQIRNLENIRYKFLSCD